MAETTNELTGKPIKRFFRLLSLERKEISYIYTYAIFNGLINLTLPLGIQAILNLTLANEISSSWVLLIVIVTLGTAVAGAMTIMQTAITETLQQRIFARASFEFAYRIPRLKLEALAEYYPPELVNRFFDVINVQKGLPKILIDFSTALLQMIFGLILLSFYHPFFIFFGFGLLFILGLIIRLTGPRGMNTSLDESEYKYQVAYWLQEIARTLSTFKLAGQTDVALKKNDKLVSGYLEARKEHFRVLIGQYASIVGFKTIVTAGLLVLGSILLIQREINLGQFVASEIIIILIINSVEKLVLSADTVYDVLTAVEKMGKVTDMPLERHSGIPFKQVEQSGGMKLSIRDLSFTYPSESQPSLYHVSFEAKPGEKICIAGFNGSGKNLLLNLMSGLYEQYSGVVAYNDIPAGNFDPIDLRAYIGDCLLQKNLFRGSLLDNLTMGKPEITLENVMWALERLNLKDYILGLPQGLYTEIMPESPQFPPSIVRKLILAKSLAKDPHLLIIEDFLYMLDREDRKAIADFLTCSELKTMVIASNDALIAQRCDRVIVLSQGAIIDQGKFEDVRQRPYASDLFNFPLSD